MRSDFCALILSHGRPDRVITYDTLRKHGYTGPIYVVVDDEDATVPEYRKRYGDQVVQFCKREAAERADLGNNFGNRRTTTLVRNEMFGIARGLGFRHFVQLDDDYYWFGYRFDEKGRYGGWPVKDLGALFDGLVEFLEATPFLSVAISQGGDHIGGGESKKVIGTKRKAMNSFVCSVDKPFQFLGQMNEDVNAYTETQRRGGLFLTLLSAQVDQKDTQSNAGGMTELYLESGTYVKSFYSVMYCPSSVTVSPLRDGRSDRAPRIHHRIDWAATAPLILPERFKKRPRTPPAAA
jgi:hypothetical protein